MRSSRADTGGRVWTDTQAVENGAIQPEATLKGERPASEDTFYFSGRVPLSKSLLNRALIIQSQFPDFKIQGTDACEDIQIMTRLTGQIRKSRRKEFNCGLSASAFRFLALRLSREKGAYFLTGEPALLNRQTEELSTLLSQAGVTAVREEGGWKIVSEGWIPQGDGISVPCQTTSQYSSGLLLSGWNLERDLFFTLNGDPVSRSHFQMSLDFVRRLGMEVKGSRGEYYIPKGQKLKVFHYRPEPDQNCLFVLSALAISGKEIVFSLWEDGSLQPEAVFPRILRQMGAPIERKGNQYSISQPSRLKPVEWDLRSTPDLFPVLAVLCAGARGRSLLSGLRHQAFKESHRLDKTAELLRLANIQTEKTEDTLTIYGAGQKTPSKPFVFDSAGDHRMVMSAVILKKLLNVPIHITGKEAVNKSFPDFFKYADSV